MTRSEAEKEMLDGYLSGLMREPEPGNNRSHSFRHGWKNGRDDKNKSPRAAASYIREDGMCDLPYPGRGRYAVARRGGNA